MPRARSQKLPTLQALSWDDCRLLVDSVTDYAIFMLDPSGLVATWNVGAERIKGYRASEIIGEHFSRFYPAEDIAAGKPELELETATRFGRVEDEGFRIRKDGSRFWASVVITALRAPDGQLRGFAKITRDVTERRMVEEQLRESEQRFHHLVDAVTDYALYTLDLDGRIASWNEGARTAKGYRAEEIIGQHFSVFFTPEDRAAGKPERILATALSKGRHEDEGIRVRKDGSRFWADAIMTCLRDDQGNVVGFAKVTRDLSERRAVEDELRRSEERFRLLVEGVADYAIYMLDTEGRVSTWNLGAERMKGYKADEIYGRSFSVFFPAEDIASGKPQRELEIARAVGRFEDEGIRVRKDGSRFWASVVVTPIRNAGGELVGFAKVTRDLSVRREAERIERRLFEERTARAAAEANEQRLRESERAAQTARATAEEAARRAETANRFKDEFLATLSHELRTPLNAIVGWSSLLRTRVSDPSLVKAIEAIHRNSQAQATLIEDILDVSRIITGKLRLQLAPVDLLTLVNEAIEVVQPSADAKRIAIALEADAELPRMVGDSERLRQVAWNLLSNAVKFTPAGGRVTVSIRHDGPNVLFSVRDTGRGIAPDFLPHVFERFRQADSSTTRAYGGLGLGLAIVRHVVELHGGQVQAESDGPDKGSFFSVRLPVRAVLHHDAEPGAEGPRTPPRADAAANLALGGVRLLVVDDDSDARDLLQDVLEGAGATVMTACSVDGALEAIERSTPDVVISDIGMPEQDGYSLVRRLRAHEAASGKPPAPAIALTAYTRSADRAKALAAGFTTHLAKPVMPDDLVAAVGNLAAFVRR